MGLLVFCSVEDIKHKSIHMNPLLLFGIAGLVVHLLLGERKTGNMVLGMAVGLLLLLLSWFSKENIGSGDGVLLMVTGIYLGAKQNMELFLTGLCFSGIWAFILILFFKKKKQDEIPFIPFLLAAYVEMLLV